MTAEESLAAIAADARGALLSFDPVRATSLGSHADDDRLPDFTVSVVRDHVSDIDDLLTAIDGVDDLDLPVDALVDLEILRARLTAEAFDLTEVARHTWDPLVWDPASGLHSLA
ncbi:MAG: hypothetical protein ACO4AG_09655, partial [Candidatus Nanopelagicales bacterium]